MRILTALLPVALVVGAPAAAQTFKPAVVGADVSPLETLWHVRVALNVAALGCRDADEAATVAAYNTLIRRQSAVLAAANDAAIADVDLFEIQTVFCESVSSSEITIVLIVN